MTRKRLVIGSRRSPPLEIQLTKDSSDFEFVKQTWDYLVIGGRPWINGRDQTPADRSRLLVCYDLDMIKGFVLGRL